MGKNVILTGACFAMLGLHGCAESDAYLESLADPGASEAVGEQRVSPAWLIAIDAQLEQEQYLSILDRVKELGVRVYLELPGNLLVVDPVNPDLIYENFMKEPVEVYARTETGWLGDREPSKESWGLLTLAPEGLFLPDASRADGLAAYENLAEMELSPSEESDEPEHAHVPDAWESDSGTLTEEDIQRKLFRLQEAYDASSDTTERADIEAAMDFAASNPKRFYSLQNKAAKNRYVIVVFYVESTGTGNENWSSAEASQALSDTSSGLYALARVAPPTMNLSFVVTHYSRGNSVNRVSYEPSSGATEGDWIKQIMKNRGQGWCCYSDHHDRVRKFDKDMKSSFGASYATAFFWVRDEVSPFANFNNSTTTGWPHAYYQGYGVMNSRWGRETTVHEFLHTTTSADEYTDSNGGSCNAQSGLGHDRARAAGEAGWSNRNHVGCGPGQSCIMGSGTRWSNTPYSRPILCWHTRAHIGWGNSVGVSTTVSGLPNVSNYSFSPTLFTRIDGRKEYQRRSFSYVQSGYRYVGANRCASYGSSRYTSVWGQYSSCSSYTNQGFTASASPNDIYATQPAFSSVDEGRVHERSVTFYRLYCGDRICDGGESSSSCSSDCYCGNGTCDGGETISSCSRDCVVCGDGICSPGESCAMDCGGSCGGGKLCYY